MVQLANPRQQPIGLFSDLQSAEAALNAVQDAGLSTEHLSVMPEALEPHPPVNETEARQSGGAAAIAGALSGAVGGLVLSYMSLSSPGTPDLDPMHNLIGLVLAGSGIGAAGGGLMGALTGATVHKGESDSSDAAPTHNYLVVAEKTPPEELAQIQAVLCQHGGKPVQ